MQEQNQLSDFTKEAIRRAREQSFNDRHEAETVTYNEDREDQERTYSVSLKESQWNYLMELLDTVMNKANGTIKRTYTMPSDTISSLQTREKYGQIIHYAQYIKEIIYEGMF